MSYNEIPSITLSMLIEKGIIEAGSEVVAAIDDEIRGTLNKNGSITLVIDDERKRYPFPSGAARAVTNTSVNGWIFWRILENGVYRDLAYFRKKFTESEKGKSI
ncbi:hypothetical protein [Pontibacter vulgaris]|uniref:restriction system modified-DNA reader domain-containing protein n=1 Tax=Pontibacter vulgaris TaxID=2905679 RepID=UPI0021D42E5C|nr:hypothetical protein [Pontibacter vulgaris]